MVCAWLFISAFYYVDTLFSGAFVLDMQEGFAHKFFKYVVCALISAYLILRSNSLFVGGISFFLFVLLTAQLLTEGAPNLFSTTVLTLFTMLGLSCTIRLYPEATRLIAASIVWSAALVGCFSVAELTLLAEKFLGYWAATGGVRSISTMFNPNNLGLYLGAALLLLPWATQRQRTMVILAIPIVFGLVASGSRTAWVSLIICLLFLLFAPRAGSSLRRKIIQYKWVLSLGVISIFVVIYLFVDVLRVIGIDNEARGVDLYTASIRWTNFISYIQKIDGYILLPDISDERVSLIQDNAFLVIFNTFGAIFCGIFLLIFLSLRLGPKLADNGRLAWLMLVFYYLVSGLSGSFINSFPNNQLFFIALGGAFIPLSLVSSLKVRLAT
jgi:hypothetical protein